MKPAKMSPVAATIQMLKQARAWRAEGKPVSYLTDPAWLVDMAINRRAGWPDDPSHHRGSARPVGGRYPCKASGSGYSHLQDISRRVNRRIITRPGDLGSWRKLILARIPNRITQPWDE